MESTGLSQGNKKALYLSAAIGAAIGAAVFIAIYGVATLDVTYDSWIYNGYIEEDIIQSYAGWMYYRAAPWSWPLAMAGNMAIPVGTSVAFTDSNPLLCMLLKVFAPLMPPTFQYFGLSNLFHFIMQGLSASILLHSFNIGRIKSALGTLMFVLSPIFLEKAFRHTALGSQYLILLSIYFYFKARREGKLPWACFLVLCTVTVGIHAYFLPMVYCFLAAALIEQMLKTRKIVKYIAFLLSCFAGTLGMAYITGILTRGGDGVASGYGSYNMNLNALFNPSSFDYFAKDKKLDWSLFLPLQDQQYHHYEGFNYLGLGVLATLCIMLAYALIMGIRSKVRHDKSIGAAVPFIRRNIWLILVCIALTVFAVSNVVCFGTKVLFTVPLPSFILKLCSIYRASGRLFWPCSYLILLFITVRLARIKNAKLSAGALALMLVVQAVDLAPTIIQKHRYFAGEPIVYNDEYTTDEWRYMAQSYSEVYCLGELFDYRLAAGLIRYNPAMRSNIVIANRGEYRHIEIRYVEMLEELESGAPLQDGIMYLCSDETTFNKILAKINDKARGYKLGDYYAFANPIEGCPLQEYSRFTEALH